MLQSRQDQAIEKLLLEMQRRQWQSERSMQEKREVIASLSEIQRARNRGIDDIRREQLA